MQEGDYTYQLTVTDTIGQQATAQVTVIVQPENNKPPQADAGPDKELTLPVDSTTLDGSKSSDDQKIISYLWEKHRDLMGCSSRMLTAVLPLSLDCKWGHMCSP